MTNAPLPTLAALKAQAKRLRADLSASDTAISHGRALEIVAHQHGFRDWNTLHAAIGNAHPAVPVVPGDRIRGKYLGQTFSGEVIGLQKTGAHGRHRITILFDEPVDVVTFDSFSSFRKRVTSVIDEKGVSPNRTSNGRPHLELEL